MFALDKAYYRLLTFAVSTDQEMVTKKTFQGQGFLRQENGLLKI